MFGFTAQRRALFTKHGCLVAIFLVDFAQYNHASPNKHALGPGGSRLCASDLCSEHQHFLSLEKQSSLRFVSGVALRHSCPLRNCRIAGQRLPKKQCDGEVLFPGRARIDTAVRCSDREAVEMSRYLLRNDGIFVGSSSCVHCVGAVKAARALPKGSTVVTILCDSGERHLSKFYSAKYLRSVGLEPSAEGSSLDFIL